MNENDGKCVKYEDNDGKRGKMEAAGRKKTRIRGTNGKLCAER